MNTFYEHHKNSIRFGYRCFDRILLNGLIQPFQQPERVVGFFGTYRNQYPVSRDVLRDIAQQFQNWVKNRSEKWNAPILRSSGRSTRRICRTLLSPCPTRPSRRYSEGTRTSPHSHRHRQQKGQSLAFAISSALGRAVQLLPQRSPLGPDVRPHESLFPLFGTPLSQPAPLASPSYAGRRHRLSTNYQCLLALPGSPPTARSGQLSLPARSADLRARVAEQLHPLLHRKGAETRRFASIVCSLPR